MPWDSLVCGQLNSIDYNELESHGSLFIYKDMSSVKQLSIYITLHYQVFKYKLEEI